MAVDFTKVPSSCYVLDEKLFERNLQLIARVARESGAEIIPAFKGFALWAVFPQLQKLFSGAAASSVFEARLAFEELKTLAHTYSPAFEENGFDDIMRYSSHISFNSLPQYHLFADKLSSFPRKISPGLRVNPEYSEVETLLYNPCAPGSRLGVLASSLPRVLPAGLEGFHFHTLCESTSYDLEKTLEAFEKRFSPWLSQIQWVNMGGGHLMTRMDYNVEHLIGLIQKFKKKYNIHVILEPGSAFAWETGYLVSSVLDIVENKGIRTAILNVSFTAHMPDCLEMPYQPKILGATIGNEGPEVYRMGGNSCLSGDVMGDWSFDAPLKPGDTIVFNDMIHYTMVKTTTFNGVQHPSIGIWKENNYFRLVKKFEYEDYRDRLS